MIWIVFFLQIKVLNDNRLFGALLGEKCPMGILFLAYCYAFLLISVGLYAKVDIIL